MLELKLNQYLSSFETLLEDSEISRKILLTLNADEVPTVTRTHG